MILSCQNISKAFGTEVILQNASFHIEEHEKTALVGMNGAGKTTLLKIIAGELPPDDGTVMISRGKTLGYLRQNQEVSGNDTIYSFVLEEKKGLLDMEDRLRRIEQVMKTAGEDELEKLMADYNRISEEFERSNGYAVRSETTGVLKGLGFTEADFDRKVSTLSGGQKTRVAMGRLLLSSPDILMLDEPTNHLDLASITWLEGYLLNYPGAVLIVAHDRYFINRIAGKIFEVENGKVMTFTGDYSAYAQKKAQLREAALKAYLKQQQEIRHQEAVITKLRQFNREKSIKRAESREKMLEKMEVLEKPQELDTEMHLRFSPAVESGNDVLTVNHLSKSFPGSQLFTDLNFTLKRGEHVAIIGDNGTGKTTILKLINGLETADGGEILYGSRVVSGYYDQEHQVLHMEKTLMEEISDEYPDMTETEIRNLLAAFLFTGDDVFKRVRDLSGGERGRLSLAKLMLGNANFLILDEPTNHLDITSKEILEEALQNYTGTVLYVSHDRYFINRTAHRILELKQQTLINYIGNYDYYLEKVEELSRIYTDTSVSGEPADAGSEGRNEWAQRKEEQARLRKKANDLKRTEEQIARLEERDRELDELLSDENTYTDPQKSAELTAEKAETLHTLEELYALWENLAE